MVATVTRLSEAASTVHYFETDGYYAKNDAEHRKASRWHGAGVAALGLHGPVKPKRFEEVLSGRIPGTTTRLGRLRDGRHEHRPGLDITFSAPKSVSLEALVHAAPKASARIIRAHDEAVTATLDFIESELLETRGWDPVTRRRPRVKGDGLVAATFRHLASRNLDPQLHTHSVVANMTRNAEGEWRSADFIKIERSKHLIGAHYRGELKRRLEALGYATEQTMVGSVPGFEIAGYDKATLRAFSTRRAEALAWVKERNLDARSAAVMQQAVLYTRKRKDEPSREELASIWQARMAEMEPRNRRVARNRPPSRARPDQERWHLERRDAANRQSRSALHAVRQAVEHLEERRTVFTANMLRSLVLAPGQWTLPEIDSAIARLTHEGHLIEATRARSDLAFVTDRAVKAERAVLRWMKKESDAPDGFEIDAGDVHCHLEASTLNDGQQAAVSTLLLSPRHVVGVQGHAGTGKTTMLKEVVELAGAERIVALAPSSSAARTLQQETGIGTKTLQWFLTRYRDVGDGCANEKALEQVRAACQGKLLVVDEASLVSMAQMHALARIAEATGIARVALVGDQAQLRSVEAGQPFRVLQKAGMETAVMDEVMRQRGEGLKAAVLHMINQKPELAIEELGPGVLEMDADELGPRAAALWLDLDAAEREATKVLAPTHLQRREITGAIREGLKAEGSLRGRTIEIERYVNLHLTRAQKGDLANWREGDVAVFHADVYGVQAKSGDIFEVIGSQGEKVLLKHPDGKTRRADPSKYLRYRVDLFETEGIELQAGERIRWTRNDRDRSLLNGEEAQILSIGPKNLKLRTADGRTLTLAHDDPQLHFIDHAWTSTVHAAQGITCDQVIAVLDANQGAIAGQAAFYVELTRARDNAVLLTDDRDGLVEALETAADDELSTLEAIGHQFREPEVAVADKEVIPLAVLSDAKAWQEEIRSTLERHLDHRLAEREVLLDRARYSRTEGNSALAGVAGHAAWRERTLAAVGVCYEHNEGFAGKADLLEKLVAFDDDLAEFDRDRQRHAQAARTAGENFALHPGSDDLIARGRALVETAPRPKEIPWNLSPFLDLVTATRREHDEAVARADAEILARLDRAERELDAVKDERRALRSMAKGRPLHAVSGHAAWRERADAAIDALRRAVSRDGEREQRGLTDALRLEEAFDHDDDVAALITDWTAFEGEARARGVEAVDLAAGDPLLAQVRHLAGNPPEGEAPLEILTRILARHQTRTEEREKAVAAITRDLDGYRARHRDTANPLSAIGEWCAGTKAAIDTWRAMTVVDERDPALSATAAVLEDIIAFEERAFDLHARWNDARRTGGAARPFLAEDGDTLAADLRALEASLPRHGDLLSSLREASQALDRHEARIAERDEAAASLTRALEDYRACHGPTDDTARQLSDIRIWCFETRNAIDAWRAMTEADERNPAVSETAAALEDLMAFEERTRDVLTRWRIASIGKDAAQRFLGPEGESLAADLKALEAGLPRHAIIFQDLRPALERLAEHERAADRARELLARAREVDDARRSLLEREGKSSRPLDRRFNRARRRWREASEAVVADIEATDAALIAHVDDTAVASRVRKAHAASDRLDSLPGWLLLRLHDNAANAGSAIHPAMTKDYAGIVSDMQRLDSGLRANDPRRVVLRGEINAYQALDRTRRTVARLLADLKVHDADTASLDTRASREDLPLQQSMAWTRWYNQSMQLEDQAREVLSGGDRNLRVVLHDGQGTRQAFEETLAHFEQTRAAHGEPDNSARLERMRQEDEERRRSWSQRRGRSRGPSM
ncbi:MAG: relaxase domain-containing protein [bacterium]|nr:relaxase domain-containing protein [bacterium]